MKKWFYLSAVIILSCLMLRPYAGSSAASARTQITIAIRPAQSVSISAPFMILEPVAQKENGHSRLKGEAMNSIAISANVSSQLRVSLLESNFRFNDRLKIRMSPFPKSQASKVYLWDGRQEAFQEQLATNIPPGSHTTSFFIEYEGPDDLNPCQLEGTLEVLLFSN